VVLKLKSYCAMDLHHSHTVFEAQSGRGQVTLHRDMATEETFLIEAVKAVRGPKGVVIEEGSMADWAMRVIRPFVTEVVVCDPRRNRLISNDGDKSDDIDVSKLIELYRLKALRPVHHSAFQSRMDLREWVWSYHDQVALVVAAKNKVKAAFRSAGLQYESENIYGRGDRSSWLEKFVRGAERRRMEVLYGNLDDLERRRDEMYKRLCRLVRRHPVVNSFQEIPGYGPVRSATFFVIVDTPFRFSRVSKLWRYGGLGLRKKQSGPPNAAKTYRDVRYNRRLKEVATGATVSALKQRDENPFQVVYERLVMDGLSDGLARLSVARKLLSVPWGMWKGGTPYDPGLVT